MVAEKTHGDKQLCAYTVVHWYCSGKYIPEKGIAFPPA